MIYVGIDIAKRNHVASVISSDDKVLIEPFIFTIDNDGFFTLLSKLNLFNKDSVIIVLESTAHYDNNLLAESSMRCLLIMLPLTLISKNFT